MLPRDDTVLVNTLCGAADDALKIFAEIGGLELGVQFGGQMVTQVLGVLGVVVAPDAPRVLVFGEVAWDELDGVEGVGFTGLAGGNNSAADGLFGDLCDEKKKDAVSLWSWVG